MSPVLRARLTVRGNRAGIVVGDHHDESGAEDHQEGQEIVSPLGFHYSPADRCDFLFEAGRGHGHKFVRQRSISLSALLKHNESATAHGKIRPSNRQLSSAWRSRRKEQNRSGIQSARLQPSAFTTEILVEEAAAEAIAGRLSNYHRNFRVAGPQLGGLSSFGSIYLSGDESKRWEGNKKPFPPEQK